MPTPLVKSFSLIGLHGYKDISIEFDGKARIIIAENGSGKTTFLAAMYRFLKADFSALRSIHFDRIECLFYGANSPLIFERDWIAGYASNVEEIASNFDLDELIGDVPLSPRDLLDTIASMEASEINRDLLEREPFRSMYHTNQLDLAGFLEMVAQLHTQASASVDPRVTATRDQIKAIMGETQVVHLPTYRRVEASLKPSMQQRRRAARPASRFERTRPPKEIPSQMQYGLLDIENRLDDLFSDIQRRSNLEYRQISASIIDGLLRGEASQRPSVNRSLPEVEDLAIFFSRLVTPQLPDHTLDRILNLYASEDILNQENWVLAFFLEKLSKVIDETKEEEGDIERFVSTANVYLNDSSDRKSLDYNPLAMKIQVRSEFNDSEIKMSELSSGEKQVISMLAFMYIFPGPKIVLIDEPELSLSLDWQRRLLPDLVSAPSCSQLLAITHSPFIFDNVLDSCVGPLHITRRPGKST